jgi:hypothetical protein
LFLHLTVMLWRHIPCLIKHYDMETYALLTIGREINTCFAPAESNPGHPTHSLVTGVTELHWVPVLFMIMSWGVCEPINYNFACYMQCMCLQLNHACLVHIIAWTSSLSEWRDNISFCFDNEFESTHVY